MHFSYPVVFKVGGYKGEAFHSAFRHSAGETHINLDRRKIAAVSKDNFCVLARLTSGEHIMEALCLADAIKRAYHRLPDLVCPYPPYGRADRVMPGGGGDSVGTDLMYGMLAHHFNHMYTMDTHSSFGGMRWTSNIMPHDYMVSEANLDLKDSCVVAPDVGGVGRAQNFANLNGLPLLKCEKKRDTSTGKIVGYFVPNHEKKHHYVVVDDICDGGGTFNLLASQLPRSAKRTLVVSHGIFSKGYTELLSNYDKIVTLNSIKDKDINDERVAFVEVEKCFL